MCSFAPLWSQVRAKAALRYFWPVVTLVLEGLSNEEIARSRGARYRTVANQLAGIYKKLGVASRTELIAMISATEVDD